MTNLLPGKRLQPKHVCFVQREATIPVKNYKNTFRYEELSHICALRDIDTCY